MGMADPWKKEVCKPVSCFAAPKSIRNSLNPDVCFPTEAWHGNSISDKMLDSFEPVMMADGKIIRGLSSICRHENRLLRDIVTKVRSYTPCFFGKSSWYFGHMPVIGVSVKNNCEGCRDKVVLMHRFSHCLNER